MTGQAGFIGNNKSVKRVGDFGGRIWQFCVYKKFGHLENMLMGGMSKSSEDELIIEAAAHAHDAS